MSRRNDKGACEREMIGNDDVRWCVAVLNSKSLEEQWIDGMEESRDLSEDRLIGKNEHNTMDRSTSDEDSLFSLCFFNRFILNERLFDRERKLKHNYPPISNRTHPIMKSRKILIFVTESNFP